MRSSLLACLALTGLFFACDQEGPTYYNPDDTGGGEGSGEEGGEEGGGDEGSEGTDNDGDGWTVEDGDCDDDDIWVNPAWDEDPNDGKDNDCDGKVDEQFAGLDIARQYTYGRADIVQIDTVSRITDTITLDSGYAPQDIDFGLDSGWVITHDPDPRTDPDHETELVETAAVVSVSTTGACTIVASFEPDETEEGFLAALAGLDDNPVIRGLVTHPDGYYLTARPGALVKVEADGSTTDVATWNYDFGEDPDNFELYAMDLAVDPTNGEVAIVGLLGGFATWSPDDGMSWLKTADLSGGWENWDAKLVNAVAYMDGGGWWALLVDYTVGSYEVVRFNLEENNWSTRMEWEESLILPSKLTMNGDNGDIYVTANAGYYHTVWLVRESQDLIDDFYNSGSAENGWFFRGLVTRY